MARKLVGPKAALNEVLKRKIDQTVVHVEFAVAEVALGQVFLRVFRFFPPP